MVPLTYDLHIHSCLSPCGDLDMTPGNIVGMAVVKQLEVVAITDHNSCKNCPSFMKIAKDYNIIAIPGMELCTAEEVHVICLFPSLEMAMDFDCYIYKHLMYFPNDESIFGKQLICNDKDEVIGRETKLLISATDIAFDLVYELVGKYGGIMIPAHIDKNSNSLLSNLGFVPPEASFTCVELKDISKLNSLKKSNPYLDSCKVICNSDAHYLEDISEPVHFIPAKSKSIEGVFEALCKNS